MLDEYVLFVAPSEMQLAIMDRLLSPSVLSAFLQHRLQPLGFSESAEPAHQLTDSRHATQDLQFAIGES